jgi:uncharacterized delta-60 repeat protein
MSTNGAAGFSGLVRRASTRGVATALASGFAVVLITASPASAAGGGNLDSAFAANTGSGSGSVDFIDKDGFTISPSGNVESVAAQVDGKVLVGGPFNRWNGKPVGHLVRLNADGTLDEAFGTAIGSGADGEVSSIAVQADGKILLGGDFEKWNGRQAGNFVRLNANGTQDKAFNAAAGAGATRGFLNASVSSVVVQADRKILLTGSFYYWNARKARGLVRLNANGTQDTAFTANIGAGQPDDWASGLTLAAVQSDRKILVGGFFKTWNGRPAGNVVRLNANGTEDKAFTNKTGTGANDDMRFFAVQRDGKIVLGGRFNQWNSNPVGHVVRLNADGTLDDGFAINAGTGADDVVDAGGVQADGKILLAGQFPTWNGNPVGRVVRLNADGTQDTAFTANSGTGADYDVESAAVQSNGGVLLGGSFTTWNGSPVGKIVRLVE